MRQRHGSGRLLELGLPAHAAVASQHVVELVARAVVRARRARATGEPGGAGRGRRPRPRGARGGRRALVLRRRRDRPGRCCRSSAWTACSTSTARAGSCAPRPASRCTAWCASCTATASRCRTSATSTRSRSPARSPPGRTGPALRPRQPLDGGRRDGARARRRLRARGRGRRRAARRARRARRARSGRGRHPALRARLPAPRRRPAARRSRRCSPTSTPTSSPTTTSSCFTFPHSPLALTRTNNRTDAPATPRRPRLEWLQDVALDNHAFGLVNRVGPAAAAGDPGAQPLRRPRRRRGASAWRSPSTCSPARGSCASRRWSTRCRGRAPPRRCGRAARSSRAIRSRSRSSCASRPATLRCSRPRTGARPPTSPCTCSRAWPSRRRSARSRRCCAAGTAGRTGASARSSAPQELAPRYPRWARLRRDPRAPGPGRALRQPLDRAHARRRRADRRVSARQRWTLAAVCVSTALLLINVAAPNVALEDIAEDLDASFTDLQWVLSGYALVLAVFQLTAGSLADLFGRKRMFVGGLCLFMRRLGGVRVRALGGRADRGPRGPGARRRDRVPELARPARPGVRGRRSAGSAIGIWGAIIGLAFAAGPLVGGLLVGAFGWQAIFGLGFVLGLPTTVLAVLQVRESRDPDPKPVDWPGVGTLSLGLFLVVFAVLRGNALGWTSATVLGLVALGLGFLVRLRRRRAARGRPDARPAPVPQPHVPRRDGDRRHARGRLVRLVRVPVAVPARRAPAGRRSRSGCGSRRSRSSPSSSRSSPGA